MLELDHSADGFDWLMEVAASVPPSPKFVAMRDLCLEFGVPQFKDIDAAFKELRKKHGIVVTTRQEAGIGRCARYCKMDWPKAKCIVNAYWQRQYGARRSVAERNKR